MAEVGGFRELATPFRKLYQVLFYNCWGLAFPDSCKRETLKEEVDMQFDKDLRRLKA